MRKEAGAVAGEGRGEVEAVVSREGGAAMARLALVETEEEEGVATTDI